MRLKPNEPLSKDDDDDFKRMRQSMFKVRATLRAVALSQPAEFAWSNRACTRRRNEAARAALWQHSRGTEHMIMIR